LIVLNHVLRCPILLAPLVSNTLRSPLVKRIPFALEPCHSRRIRVPGADIQLLTTLAGLVGVQQA
jgi:hypothetical protein